MFSEPSEKRLYLQIAEQLLAQIQSGEVAVGERLPAERQLAEQFSVSRPTVREAMIALEVSGIVEIRSGSGVYVIGQSNFTGLKVDGNIPGPFEILEARLNVESDVAYLAAQRISSKEIHQLRFLLKQMKDQEKCNLDMAHSLDRDFHHLIAVAARNSTMAEMVDWLWQLRNRSEINTVFDNIIRERGTVTIIEEHQNIIDALQRRDAVGAKDAMKQHIQRVINEFSQCTLNDD